MPAYEICYLDKHGRLARTFSVQSESEMRAKILAHAMKPAECPQLEVWDGKMLVYSRPEQIIGLQDLRALDAPLSATADRSIPG